MLDGEFLSGEGGYEWIFSCLGLECVRMSGCGGVGGGKKRKGGELICSMERALVE